MSGSQDVVIASGVESMTRVPMGTPVFLPMQAGIGIGPWSQSIRDRYGVNEFSQFTGAEMMARKYGFNRDELDEFALGSHRKAVAAAESDAFEREILVVDGVDNRGIGECLGISPRTVEVHKSRVMTKLGARNLAELIRIAGTSGRTK